VQGDGFQPGPSYRLYARTRRDQHLGRIRLIHSSGYKLTLASGTAWALIECTAGRACRGTDGPNTMYGSGSEDRIYGKGGADVIDSRGGADELYGGDGHDAGLYGGNGRDLVQGGAREDKAIGGFRRRHDARGRRT
jgi:Ca2+-binding RTX toxin-like protein